MMNIPELIKEHHQAMIDKGFYPDGEEKNIGELLMLIVSELSEALESHRNKKFADSENCIFLLDEFKQNFVIDLFEKHIKDTFEDEIADVFLRLFDLCGYLGEDEIYPVDNKFYYDNIGEEFLFISNAVVSIRFGNYRGNKFHIGLIFSRLNTLCQNLDIPIEKHITAKMSFNKTRPHKHGKQY